jgi:light-regulated signal transduction histidine kinase (bacteriophytochrome)
MRSAATSEYFIAGAGHGEAPRPDALSARLDRLADDLDRIGYAASHDLQAPLRAMLACCDTLNAPSRAPADREGKEALATLSREALRMKALLQGLLDYVNLETFTPACGMQDGNEIAATALAALEDRIHASGARVTVDDLPAVYGHRGRLTRLFTALIENAVTFNRRKPEIRISARDRGREWEFCVEDNGIGVGEEYHDMLGQLFCRLHAHEGYPGHGIGLALGRKIVQSLGGTLSVEPAPAGGSRFLFTLPKQEASCRQPGK